MSLLTCLFEYKTLVFFSIEQDNPFQNKHLCLLTKQIDSDIYDYVSRLFHDTWKDDSTGTGADAKGLRHTAVEITHIYGIHNAKLEENYKDAHAIASIRFEDNRDVLRDDAILTRKIQYKK